MILKYEIVSKIHRIVLMFFFSYRSHTFRIPLKLNSHIIHVYLYLIHIFANDTIRFHLSIILSPFHWMHKILDQRHYWILFWPFAVIIKHFSLKTKISHSYSCLLTNLTATISAIQFVLIMNFLNENEFWILSCYAKLNYLPTLKQTKKNSTEIFCWAEQCWKSVQSSRQIHFSGWWHRHNNIYLILKWCEIIN